MTGIDRVVEASGLMGESQSAVIKVIDALDAAARGLAAGTEAEEDPGTGDTTQQDIVTRLAWYTDRADDMIAALYLRMMRDEIADALNARTQADEEGVVL